MTSYWRSVVTIWEYLVPFSEINGDFSQKLQKFSTHVYLRPI